jgi:type IV pilus assembly protein PilQ
VRRGSEEDQRKAEDLRKDRELKLMVEKGLLKQILIEAKIIEATETFVRNIGVTWGFTTTGSTRNYGIRSTGGSSTLQTNSQSFSYPYQIPYVKGNTTDPLTTAAVNFPTQPLLAGQGKYASPAIGVVFGGAAGFLEAQLAALEANSTGKVISAPKVVTMEGVKATVKQGAEVPYVTPASGTSPATVSFKEALLKLEVKPKITDEGKISMEITATNDQPDYNNSVQGNPPINKSELVSTIVVQDGDTIVIGGVFKSTDSNDVSGLPWLQKIPVLGWLFKTDNTTKEKKQILVFVTPKILKGSSVTQTTDKFIN